MAATQGFIFYKNGQRNLKICAILLLRATERTKMLTNAQVDSYISKIPKDVLGEERRAASATITGFAHDKSIAEIASYYSISRDSVIKWMEFFNLSTTSEAKRKRSSKSSSLTAYVQSNVGKEVTPKSVAEELGISLPTFYNFYNANRQYFKKIKRGIFEILDPQAERSK